MAVEIAKLLTKDEARRMRKKTSTFTGLVGQRVAAKGVTVVDDGSATGRPTCTAFR
jgi:predicted Zn-dependent protease